jgi:hypothetical protein
MGLEWDPDGDAERSKESRKRLFLTIAIVLAILGFVAKKLYERDQQQQRDREMEMMRNNHL